jgi:hypothetical protein
LTNKKARECGLVLFSAYFASLKIYFFTKTPDAYLCKDNDSFLRFSVNLRTVVLEFLRVTPGSMPSTLRAALRALKIVPVDFASLRKL